MAGTPEIKNIQGRIADLLDLRFEKETEEGRAAQLWHRLQEKKKVFVILDDVWKEFNLADIGIPFGDNHKGCKVLLTTRLQHVCTRMGSQKRIQLDVLSNDEAWTLVKHNAGLSEFSGYGKLDEVAQKVSRECRGLPLAIVTIARALREKTLDEWMVANQQPKSSQLVENQDFCQDIYGCLKFSYDYLKGRKIKLCFFLCSHFPEDYEISVEDLTRYVIGQGLFQDVDFIEDTRREARVILTTLQCAGLLLDTSNEGTVKMHDVVRDFAHWIASEGESQLMIKAGLGLKEWPHSETLACCTTISLMNNKIGHLPEDLACPKLETLLLSGNDLVGFSNASFKGMKSLKVLTLSVSLLSSLEGLLPLTNLKSLCLRGCKLCDISSLCMLKKLEILDFRGCFLEKVPDELGQLNNLKLLDLSYVGGNWMIPPNLIQKQSKLEELYTVDSRFSSWTTGGTGELATAASISELNSLSRLTALTMKANCIRLPQDFVFPKLQSVMGHQSLVPSLDQMGLNNLTLLRLRHCRDIQCLIHTALQQVPAISLFNLVVLCLEDMVHLKELCNGPHPTGFLHKLEKFTVKNCPTMISTVPVVKNLSEATVINCPRLLEVFQLDNLLNTKEENHASLLSHLTHLEQELLPNLRCIWQGPVQCVSIQSLWTVKVHSCDKLTSLFSPVHAQGLLQLETLEIHDCSGVKHIITETIHSDNHPLCLPKLTTLKISCCDILEYVFPISMGPDFPQLKEINITSCTLLKQVFSPGKEMDGKDIVLPQLRSLQSLEVLEVEECPMLAPFVFEEMMRAYIKRVYSQKLWLCKVGNNCQPCNNVSLQGRQSASGMEYLRVGNCEEIFQLEGAFFLSSLDNLYSKDLQDLQVIWKGPTQIATLKHLTHLEIVECKRLRYIFSPMFAPNFPQLRDLHLKGCEELEQIIAIDQTLLSSSKGHLRPNSFPNLTKMLINNCNKLKYVFPISAAQDLPKLEELKVEGGSELEHVFEHEDKPTL
ncbi:probable disease resistance protein At4g27220 [Durio zibethinus]|uniref:Probable disease resistance protein At4g27220 n=1 Tax=Durio zibethinus TaxID=66656 RepID=A0A6P5WPM4_DURZI|nr:probable disease resistance protein At4g27220 [Durio zibethinus]